MGEITIVMAAYNGAAYIEEQVNSILKSDFQDFEIHVYDDGSKDDTREILKRLSGKYPEKLQSFENSKTKGVIRNFLEGAARADSPYIMFSDQDDVWLPDKLSVTLRKMKEREQAVGADTPIVVFTDTKVVDSSLQEIFPSFHKSSHLDPGRVDLAHLLMENKLIGCTMMINRAMQKKLSVVPGEIRMHDWWIGLLGAALGEVCYVSRATLLYRQHENNVVGSQSFFGYVRNRLSAIGKQREALQRSQRQAEELLLFFGGEMPEEKQKITGAFSALQTEGFWKKRYLLIKYGFWKTGLIRNIGVFLLI